MAARVQAAAVVQDPWEFGDTSCLSSLINEQWVAMAALELRVQLRVHRLAMQGAAVVVPITTQALLLIEDLAVAVPAIFMVLVMVLFPTLGLAHRHYRTLAVAEAAVTGKAAVETVLQELWFFVSQQLRQQQPRPQQPQQLCVLQQQQSHQRSTLL
jgi:positive regulator of sigma E activity